MTKRQFKNLFLRALRQAARMAEIRLDTNAAHSFLIELHASTSQGDLMSIDQAVDQLYLGSDKFYRVIDVAITRLTPCKTIAFVRVSGHSPGPFSQTWDPENFGPFKQIIAQHIEQERTRM